MCGLYISCAVKPHSFFIPTTSINRIIKNPIYTGVIRNGDSQSEVLPELQIIDAETYERAQQMMEKRVT